MHKKSSITLTDLHVLLTTVSNDVSGVSAVCSSILSKLGTQGRHRGRRAMFGVDIQEAAYAIWTRDTRNPEVISMGNSKPQKRHSFCHSRSELAAIGILSIDDFVKVLRARTNRTYRHKLMRLN